jgi:predicted Fe-Mo cluster-binding NifX family protein
MRIILSTASPSLDSDIDPRFGRSAYLLAVDTETLQWQAHPNPGVHASGGAGSQAAQFVAAQKAEAVISGDFGPNAFAALQAAGISMYLYGQARKAQEAIERFQTGQLQQVGAPTARGHHG